MSKKKVNDQVLEHIRKAKDLMEDSENREDFCMLCITSDSKDTTIMIQGHGGKIVNSIANAMSNSEAIVEFFREASRMLVVNDILLKMNSDGFNLDEVVQDVTDNPQEAAELKAFLLMQHSAINNNKPKTEA